MSVTTSMASRAPLRFPFFLSVGVFSVAALQLINGGGLHCQHAKDPSPHSAAEFIPEVRSIRPGEPFTVGLKITLDPGWHSYWLNPGDAGQPASIDWEIPAGFRVGEIQWPYPRTVEESTVVSYGYVDEVMLLTEILPPRFMTTGHTVRFAAKVHWLVCDIICLPASADLAFELGLTETQPAPNARWEAAFAETRRRLPVRADGWEMSASLDDDSIVLEMVPADMFDHSFEGARFFSSERGVISHGAPQVVSQEEGIVRITLRKSQYLLEPLERLTGVLVMPGVVDLEMGKTRALVVDAALSEPTSNEMEIENRASPFVEEQP